MKKGTAVADSDELTDAELEKFERLVERRKAKERAAERDSRVLTSAASLRRNETGAPFAFTAGCTAGDELLPKEIRCDGSDPGCRQRRSKPLAAPGELFWVPAGHRKAIRAFNLPEVDQASVADEPTAQDRLVLGELRAVKRAAEGPATQAVRIFEDLEAQERILAERKLQQQAEVDLRQAHVQAAEAKIEEFAHSRSESWGEALLAGAAEALLAEAKRVADEADRRRPEIHTVDDLRRAQAGDTGPEAYAASRGGEPVRLKVGRQ